MDRMETRLRRCATAVVERQFSGATVALVLAIVAAVMFFFLAVIYTRWTVALYPDEIRRE
ncbi:hypothetical protein JMUB6875_15130 [Nocardia sp. JMUB6875]